MLILPQYRIHQKIYEGIHSTVYQGQRLSDDRPVILKVLTADFPSPVQLARYQHEYELLSQLALLGVIQTYGLEKFKNTVVLVLEDFGGYSLTYWLTQRSFTITEWLSLAIQMTDNLGQLHAANVIHKDINPSNFVWNPTTGQLKLIDLGIATRFPRETLALQNPNQLEGTLPYLSPEQTGRMNRALDYRTDLYSLGITFYELLTSRLPFATAEALELVHCHLAQPPPPPPQFRPEIPVMISHLILRLLAKAAEERYQSAWGLKADLEACWHQLQTTGQIEEFICGQHDFSDKFQIPPKLYGRESEIELLLAAFARVATSTTENTHPRQPATPQPPNLELMLIAGYSGIGKSMLVREIYKVISQQRGYFIAGKFDQFQRNIPYRAIVSAVADLMRQLLTESETQLNQWREQILAAVGPNGQVVIDMIPEVELIIGCQPVVPTLGPTETQHRFNSVFQNFIRIFAQPQHPLVWFIDDLQWADLASLKFLELIMSNAEIHHLLVLGAYRDNEVNAAHPLLITLDQLRAKSQARLTQITLGPLNQEDLTDLISETLHCAHTTVAPLATLVNQKTAGNPFFVHQFLHALYQEQLLTFMFPTPANSGGWQWNLSQIEEMEITNNVVALIIGKLKKLPATTQQVLPLAAGIGYRFDLPTLSIIHEQSLAETAQALLPALLESLILPTSALEAVFDPSDANDSNDSSSMSTKRSFAMPQCYILHYKFLHDRVQQAAYALINTDQKPAVHLKIGQLLLAQDPDLEKSEKLFEIIDHLNIGYQLITTLAERRAVIQWNLLAGRKAKLAAAYGPAVKYLQLGLDLLTLESAKTTNDEDKRINDALTLNLYVEAVESYYLNAQFEQSEQLAALALSHTQVLLEQVKIYEILIQSYVAQNQLQRALDTALAVLAMLQVTMVEQPPTVLHIEELLQLPAMTALDKLAAMRILNFTISSAYTIAPTLIPKVAFTMVQRSINYGNSAFSAYGYSVYGLLLCSGLGNIEAGYQFGCLAVQVLDKFAALEFKAKVLTATQVAITPWKQPLQTTLAPLQEAIQSGLDCGDREYACIAAMHYSSYLFWLGSPLSTVTPTLAKYLDLVRQANQEYQQIYIKIWAQVAFNLQNPVTTESTRLHGPLFNAEETLPGLLTTNYGMAIFAVYLAQTMLSYLFGDYATATAQAKLATHYESANAGVVVVAIHQFYYSLAMLAHYSQVDASTQQIYLAQVTANQTKMQYWATHAPMNFQHKYDLVAAEIARVSGEYWSATKLYETAIGGARANGYLAEEALACELATKFYLTQHLEELVHTYLSKAYYLYQRWGALAKLQSLENTTPSLQNVAWSPGLTTGTVIAATTVRPTVMDTTRFTSNTEWLDLSSIMKATQVLSEEIVLDKLLTTMMHTLIENAGAQRGVLILAQNQQWVIQAEGTIQKTTVQVLQALPLAGQLPMTVINYVLRTKQPLVLDHAQQEAKYQADDYIRKHSLKSLLCLPLLHQQRLVGIIYLENNLAEGVFTPARFRVLTLLSSQMAISLENALFVTQLQQAQQAEVQARQAAEAANYTKTAFLANVSHEFRTPLNGILGYTQLFLNEPSLTEKQLTRMNVIHRSGKHLLTLVDDILDISKLQTARVQLQLSNLYLNKCLTDIAEIFRDQANQKGLLFQYQATAQLPIGVWADTKRLRQILLHLLSNALKFTQQGGTVTFQVQSESCTDRIGWHHFRFIVTDTGCGIAEANWARIFIPFEQVSDWLHKSEGAGLGLALAKQLVELMDGQITVTSQLGQGSTFTVQLDLEESLEYQMTISPEEVPAQAEILPPPTTEFLLSLKGPSAKKATELYELTQMGDFFGIFDWIAQLEQEETELKPFVEQVRGLAKDYKDELIGELAQRFMEKPAGD